MSQDTKETPIEELLDYRSSVIKSVDFNKVITKHHRAEAVAQKTHAKDEAEKNRLQSIQETIKRVNEKLLIPTSGDLHGVLRFFLDHPELQQYHSDFFDRVAFAQERESGDIAYTVANYSGDDEEDKDNRYIENMTVWYATPEQFETFVGDAPYAKRSWGGVRLKDMPEEFGSFLSLFFNKNHVIKGLVFGETNRENVMEYEFNKDYIEVSTHLRDVANKSLFVGKQIVDYKASGGYYRRDSISGSPPPIEYEVYKILEELPLVAIKDPADQEKS